MMVALADSESDGYAGGVGPSGQRSDVLDGGVPICADVEEQGAVASTEEVGERAVLDNDVLQRALKTTATCVHGPSSAIARGRSRIRSGAVATTSGRTRHTSDSTKAMSRISPAAAGLGHPSTGIQWFGVFVICESLSSSPPCEEPE